MSFLLDEENYFLPRYLAINEIKTVITFGKESYHQRFHQLFTKFIESFIPIAHLISVSGRDRLLPIVGFSNLHSLHSFWRFNPNTCKFNTGGPLPYFKVRLTNYLVRFYKKSNILFSLIFKARFKASQWSLFLFASSKYASISPTQPDVTSSHSKDPICGSWRTIRQLDRRCHVFDRKEC